VLAFLQQRPDEVTSFEQTRQSLITLTQRAGVAGAGHA